MNLSTADPFRARRTLGLGFLDAYLVTALEDLIDLGRAPVTLENALDSRIRTAG
jgi:hypothetical protein